MSDQGRKNPKLLSPSELKGKKSGAGRKRGAIWQILAMVVVLGVALGIYKGVDLLKTEEPTPTLPPSTSVRLIERDQADLKSITVQLRGEQPYTVLQINAGEPMPTPTPAPTPEPTEAAAGAAAQPEATPEPAEAAAATEAPVAEAPAATEAVEAAAEDAATPVPTATPAPVYAIDGRPGFLLDASAAKSMAGYCAALSASKQVAENAEDLAAYGLADPAIRVTMNYRDGTSDEWLFGDKVPTGTSYYFAKAGERAVYLVYGSPYTAFNKRLNALHTAAMPVTLASESIRDLRIEQQGLETVELKYTESSDTQLSISAVQLVQPFVYDAHSERTTQMFDAVAALTLKGYAGERSQLPEAGMDQPRARIHAEDESGQVLDFYVGNYADAATVYVQVDDSDTVYLCDASLLAFLGNAKASYLVDQFSNLVNILKVDAIDIKSGSESYALSIDRQPALNDDGTQQTDANGKPKTNDTYYFDGEVTDTDLFKKLYQVIIGVMGSRLSDDRDIQGDVVAQVKYTLNVEPGSFTVEYLQYTDEYYAVRRDGMTLFLIKKSQVDGMLTHLANYRDGTFVAPN
ncbi:MAG: DUF4340 domain-containing protein [Clostridiales bacterium]|nr:DUF4340 domain-containing protein [Clostridiales bacterium]